MVATVRVLPDKSHASDPLPTNPLKAVCRHHHTVLTNLHVFNSSQANGLVPEDILLAIDASDMSALVCWICLLPSTWSTRTSFFDDFRLRTACTEQCCSGTCTWSAAVMTFEQDPQHLRVTVFVLISTLTIFKSTDFVHRRRRCSFKTSFLLASTSLRGCDQTDCS